MNRHCEVLIIGAGIVGCALAESLARNGLAVTILEAGVIGGGCTAAGMGHLVALDGSPAEWALSLAGVQRWQVRAHALPAAAEYRECGTLWLASSAAEMNEAERKAALYTNYGVSCQLLTAEALYQHEPELAPGLAGGLLVQDEAVMYPPAACQWLLERAQAMGAQLLRGRAQRLEQDGVRLEDGRCLRARQIVVAAGNQSRQLLPELPLQPRKGQLVITERYPGKIHHQLVELGYLQSAHGNAGESVAFNVQPRATGQLLIGSSRQFADTGLADEIDWPLLQKMLARAFHYLPGLRSLQAIRTWAGFRPATPDKLPLLGPLAGHPGVWLATGHEGLGVTTALSSAELLSSLMIGLPPSIDPRPFDPNRFSNTSTPVCPHALEDALT